MKTPKLIKLDEITLRQHIDLKPNDHCYYWRTYTPNEKYNFSETNQLIKNFKISPQERHRLHHKEKAIQQIAHEFIQVIPKNQIYQNYTFVPIPPSKPINHLEYDDRLLQVLKQVQQEHNDLDFRLLIKQKESTSAAHTIPPKERLSINELCSLYVFENLNLPSPKKIVIFDDILTKGSHFKAMQSILNREYPQAPIIGLFVAISIYEKNKDAVLKKRTDK